MMRIAKAAVLGAGTMGAQIAAHLANAGVPTLLLDIAPRELTPDEQAKGLGLDSQQVRNRIARNGFEAAKKAKPAAFFTPDVASLVTVGNFDDDLAKLKDCDLIIEAVVENLEIKRSSTNASSSIDDLVQSSLQTPAAFRFTYWPKVRSDDFRAHFLGMHFFNPPRYLHLVEIIRTEWTKPEVSCFMLWLSRSASGQRRGAGEGSAEFHRQSHWHIRRLYTIKTMLDDGYSIEEVDKITGPAVGRPKSATFRTFDLVGLDVFAHVIKNLYEALPDDEEREMFVVPEFAHENGRAWLARKQNQGGLLQKTERRRRQARNLDARHRDTRLSAGAKGEAAFARHGEKHRGHARTDQGAGVGKGSRRRVSLEDTVADTLSTPRNAFRKSPTPSLKSIARCAGASVGSWDRLKSGTQSESRNLLRE